MQDPFHNSGFGTLGYELQIIRISQNEERMESMIISPMPGSDLQGL